MGGRRPKTNRVPRTRAGGTWTEAGFWGWMRSGLRRMSLTWPPLRDIMRRNRRPYSGPDKRTKWEHRCDLCGGWFKAKEIEVDHIEPCGSLREWGDVEGFVRRLFCEGDGLRKTCVECNQARNIKECG